MVETEFYRRRSNTTSPGQQHDQSGIMERKTDSPWGTDFDLDRQTSTFRERDSVGLPAPLVLRNGTSLAWGSHEGSQSTVRR